MTTATPLAWPEGWPRTPEHQKKGGHGFKKKRYVPPSQPGGSGYDRLGAITFAEARDLLFAALKKLKASSAVVSTAAHPDKGGSDEAAQEVNAARKQALKEIE